MMPTPLQSFYIVRFNDCDPMGHLNNARYIDYMLNAREDHLRDGHKILLPDFAKKGVTWVVTGHEIQYIRPAFYSETVCIASALIEAGDSYIMVEIVMYDEKQEQIKAVLWTTFTHINMKTGKREKHAADFQQFLSGIATNINAGDGLKARISALLAGVKKGS